MKRLTKKVSMLTLAAALALTFIGCDDSKPTKGNLVGTWEQICEANNPKKESTSEAGLELFKDGTGVIQEGKTSVSIKWELRDGNRLQLDAGTLYGTRIYEAELSEKGKVLALDYNGGIELFIKKGEKEGIAEVNAPFTFTDSRDGKKYKAVKIGNQTWMAENLNFEAKDSKVCFDWDEQNKKWLNCKSGCICYDNKPENCEKYGRLYVHWTAMEICPEGWHLPTNEEWETLTNNMNGSYRCADISNKYNTYKKTAGKHLKAKEGWNEDGNGTDTYGFSALPGNPSYSFTGKLFENGIWWSATIDGSYGAYYQIVSGDSDHSGRKSGEKANLYSVRCIKDSADAKPQKPVETKEEPAAVEEKKEDKQPATLTDSRDNKTYKTVKIGEQNWMAENLNYNATGSVCYDNNSSNCQKYGKLYNWATAKTVCPAGWHLPSEGEWDALAGNVGSSVGKNLKANEEWGGANKHGFSALPGGLNANGKFSGVGSIGLWWSATEYDSGNALRYIIDASHDNMDKFHNEKTRLLSVRCVED